MSNSKTYTVWVGGVEVNDYYLTFERASELADEWVDDGYDDVVIEKVEIPHDSVVRFFIKP